VTEPVRRFTCEPHPDHPGWHHWRLKDPTFYNEVVLGTLLVRSEDENRARCRILPQRHHLNAGGHIHGALLLGFMDVTLFTTYFWVRDRAATGSQTIDLASQFIERGDGSKPLDAVVEVLRETGRFCFMRGLLMQDDTIVASYNGTIRKRSQPRPVVPA
jgi:acyl-coenzyme A thioesterase PaaI-like protein